MTQTDADSGWNNECTAYNVLEKAPMTTDKSESWGNKKVNCFKTSKKKDRSFSSEVSCFFVK